MVKPLLRRGMLEKAQMSEAVIVANWSQSVTQACLTLVDAATLLLLIHRGIISRSFFVGLAPMLSKVGFAGLCVKPSKKVTVCCWRKTFCLSIL
jgi:hypothetical protein